MSREQRINALKMLPGLLISAFFIWWTFLHRHKDGTRGFDSAAFHQIHIVAPVWFLGLLGFSILGYGARCFRVWIMLRKGGARLYPCARVFMASLAANNVLPFRVGDVMRIFSYAPDVNAAPSVVLGTVILEKLTDILMLVLLLVATLHTGVSLDPKTQKSAEVAFAISFGGLLVLMFGARALKRSIQSVFAKLPAALKKIEHWILLALDAMADIGLPGLLALLVVSVFAWFCEGLLYFSAMRLTGLTTASGAPLDWGAPFQTVSLANFAFLVPSAPGGLGTFEWACQNALKLHGVAAGSAGIFGLMIHLWLLVGITAVGGGMFFVHRLQLARRKPLLEKIHDLPVELP